MLSTHPLWDTMYGASGLVLAMNSAATGLNANTRARLVQIQSLAATNNYTSPGEDQEVLYAIKTCMASLDM